MSCKYLREFSKKFETVLMGYSGAGGKLIDEKTRNEKSRDTVPLRSFYFHTGINFAPITGSEGLCFIFLKSQLFCTLLATHQCTVPEVILLDDFRPNTMKYLEVLPQENIWLPRVFSSPNSFRQLCQYQSGYFPKLNDIFRGCNSSLG